MRYINEALFPYGWEIIGDYTGTDNMAEHDQFSSDLVDVRREICNSMRMSLETILRKHIYKE